MDDQITIETNLDEVLEEINQHSECEVECACAFNHADRVMMISLDIYWDEEESAELLIKETREAFDMETLLKMALDKLAQHHWRLVERDQRQEKEEDLLVYPQRSLVDTSIITYFLEKD